MILPPSSRTRCSSPIYYFTLLPHFVYGKEFLCAIGDTKKKYSPSSRMCKLLLEILIFTSVYDVFNESFFTNSDNIKSFF